MDRIHEHSLYYDGNVSVSQSGGGPRSTSPNKGKTYLPADIDGETSTALDKFRKANRLLQKELNEVKTALEKEKNINKKLTQQLKSHQL